MNDDMAVLCLDVGSGTQDVLYRIGKERPANWPKFVLPSPAKRVDRTIRALTGRGAPLHLTGSNMGGGFFHALKAHLEAGLTVSAHPAAAKALFDDLSRLEAMGVELCSFCPAGHVPVHLADFDPGFWEVALAGLGLPRPDLVLAAAQDHGDHSGESNRRGRFRFWERLLLEAGGRPEAMIFDDPPPELTRLRALLESMGGGYVSDTGAAAVLGALADPEFKEIQERSLAVLLNMGNSHAIAFLVHQGRILGVYEQHTGLVNGDRILADLKHFQKGGLESSEVFDAGGHGCLTLDLPDVPRAKVVHVLGPRRDELSGDVRFLHPGGDMMTAGCLGLLHGLKLKLERET